MVKNNKNTFDILISFSKFSFLGEMRQNLNLKYILLLFIKFDSLKLDYLNFN